MKEDSINYIKNKVDINPNVGVILGSGLANLISTLINTSVFSSNIKHPILVLLVVSV